MRTRSGIWLVSATLALVSGAPLQAAGFGSKGPALSKLLSDDTVFYVSADATRFEYGMSSLSLAALLRDEEVQEFLAPLYQQASQLDPTDPVASILDASPISDYLAGKIAFGISGLRAEVVGPDGQPTTLRLSPAHPISARLLHNLSLLHSGDEGEEGRAVHLSVDFLAVLEPGPALRQMGHDFLSSPPQGVEVGQVQMAGVPVTAVNFTCPLGPIMTIYADLSGDRWMIGGDQSSFSQALQGGPADSLFR